jgi:hypothetical protein
MRARGVLDRVDEGRFFHANPPDADGRSMAERLDCMLT